MILKELRKKKGVSQEDAAKALGITLRTYQNYEYGQREPNIEMILKLSDYFNVSTDYLLGREKKKSPEMTSEDTRFEEELLSIYRSMPEEYRKLLYDSIRAAVLKNHSPEQIRSDIKKVIFDMLSVHKASAGCGYDLEDSDQWRSVEVVDTPELHEADFAVEVDGDSMLPDFEDGDIVYVVKSDEVPVGKIGLFIQNGKGYIKKAGEDRLMSLNPEYDDIYPENGEIIPCGIIIGKAVR